MSNYYCFARGCKLRNKSTLKKNSQNGVKNPSLFKPPNIMALEKWRKVIPKSDKEMTMKDRICELHFDEQSIIRYYEQKLKDGSTFKLERGRPCLVPGAVPSIFPDISSCLTKHDVKKGTTSENDVHMESLEHIEINLKESAPSQKENFVQFNAECKQDLITSFDLPEKVPAKPLLTNFSESKLSEEEKVNVENFKMNKVCCQEKLAIIKEENSFVQHNTEFLEKSNLNSDLPKIISVNSLSNSVNFKKRNFPVKNFTRLKNTKNLRVIHGELVFLKKKNSVVPSNSGCLQGSSASSIQPEHSSDLLINNFTFKYLTENIHQIVMPTTSWNISFVCELTAKYVMCVKWHAFEPERRVIIDDYLNVKVFLKTRELTNFAHNKVNSLNDVAKLLKMINNYALCAGIDYKETNDCLLYLEVRKNFVGRRKIWCTKCFTTRRRNAAILRKRRNKQGNQASYFLCDNDFS